MKTRFSPNKMILTSTHCTPSRIKTRNFLTKLTVLTKSNMNSSTTISPNTITTANTPRSLTDRCEGNIFSVLEPICTTSTLWKEPKATQSWVFAIWWSLFQSRRTIRASAGSGPHPNGGVLFILFALRYLKLHQTLEVKNIFKQEKMMLLLTFNPGLTLTGFRTTRPHWGSLSTYNLGQNKWNIWTTPPPISMMPKWRVSCSFAPSSLLWGGWGIIVPFYTVQDCSLLRSHY